MLGIGCPDSHALPHITSAKTRRPRHALPPASGFVQRRILVVAERPGEGPFAMRFADLRHGGLRGAGSALASRLRAGWMEARVTKVARVSARFSKSLARRRLRQPSSRAMDEFLRLPRLVRTIQGLLCLPSGTKSGTQNAFVRSP